MVCRDCCPFGALEKKDIEIFSVLPYSWTRFIVNCIVSDNFNIKEVML
jgi:hypothetical protein